MHRFTFSCLIIWVLLAFFLLPSFTLRAQNPNDLFLEKAYDFGTIHKEDNPVSHRFELVNSSTEGLKITKVTASCGCTTPDWTKTQMQPNDTGYVEARFSPDVKPGPFRKLLTVHTSDPARPVQFLYITGTVTEEGLPKGADTASYKSQFDYNHKTLAATDSGFQQLLEKMAYWHSKGYKIRVNIQSSASKVPTQSYKNNQLLASQRAKTAAGLLRNTAAGKGILPAIESIKIDWAKVQGPAYNNDHEKNSHLYEPYQYVKFYAMAIKRPK